MADAPAPAAGQRVPPRHAAGRLLGERKYDGVRGYWDGHSLRARRRNRGGPAWFTAGWPTTPMDGELWAGRGRFAHAQSTTRQQQPDDAAWRQMRFMVFDLPAHGGVFDERLGAALKTLVASIQHDWVQAVPSNAWPRMPPCRPCCNARCAGWRGADAAQRQLAGHRSGRSDDLIKLKTHDDAEALVVGHLPGKGKPPGGWAPCWWRCPRVNASSSGPG